MKRIMTWVWTAACVAVIASVASADPATPRVDRRQANQQARIAQGAHSGQLTRGETRRLRRGERHIRRSERRAKADGVVTPRERARLHRKLNRESRAIHRAKTNARTR